MWSNHLIKDKLYMVEQRKKINTTRVPSSCKQLESFELKEKKTHKGIYFFTKYQIDQGGMEVE